jgi:hypothetical protein
METGGKIRKTAYKYVQVCYLLPQTTSLSSEHQAVGLRLHQRIVASCLEVAVHASLSVLFNTRYFVNNGFLESLNSHGTPAEHTVIQEPPQEKIWYSKFGRPSRPSDVAETTNTGITLLHVPTPIATDRMKWRPLICRSTFRQPRQLFALVQYSNLKCVSRHHATMCVYIYIYIYIYI